jgi:GTP cyclohydrolase I/GTP cyclohydrolase-4
MATGSTAPLSTTAPDVQSGTPVTKVSLSRVGVTGVEKVIRVRADGDENLYHAEFECFVDLNPRQAGVHMSRFEEVVGEAIDEVVLGEAFRAEVLARARVGCAPRSRSPRAIHRRSRPPSAVSARRRSTSSSAPPSTRCAARGR